MGSPITNVVTPGTQRIPIGGPQKPQAPAIQGAMIPPPVPITPPMGMNIKSHQIKHPDGTTITQTYHPSTPGLMPAPNSKATPQSAPAIRQINGKHHIPFKRPDGSFGFVDAQGNIS